MIEQTEAYIETKQSKPFDPIGTLFRHWLKIAVFGSILFLLFSPLMIFKERIFYKTDGKLLVSPNVQAQITSTEETSITGYYRDYVQTQCERIKDPKILEKAIESLPPEIKDNFSPDQSSISTAAITLSNRLKVDYTYGTYFISISLEGSRPEGLAEVINASMDTYLEQTALELEGQETRRLTYLEAEKERIGTEIAELTEQYKTISMEIGSVNFKEAGNIQNNILVGLQQKHIEAYTQRIKKENALKAAINEAAAIQALSIDADVEDFVLRSGVASQMDIQAYQQIQELKESLEGLAENNPDRKIIEDQIQNLTASLEYSKNMMKVQTRKVLEGKRNAELQEKIVLAQTEFEAAQAAEKELKEKIDSVMSDKVSTSNKILDGQQIEKEIENRDALLSRIEERINVLRVEARAPGRISIASRALSPREPSGSNLKKLMAYCFIFAFGSVTFICVLFDVRDKRVRSRKDILDALGAKVTWPISNYDITKTEDIPFVRATLDDSLNVVSKAIHSLTIRLDKERREQNAKIAVFTGIDANSGTTEILINVAYAMTKLCGRILVLDANLVNPGLGRILTMGHISPGLVDLLISQENYEKCIFRNDERGLDVMPAGQVLPLNEINLIDRSRITSLLSVLKDQYDFILIDTTPILVSDFTEFFALQSDVIALNVQGDRSGYGGLYMTGTIFNRLQVKAVAVVLNWGGPRERNILQVTVSKFLEPITKRIITSPKWDIRHLSSQSQSIEAGKRDVRELLKKIMARFERLSKKISRRITVIILAGILLFSMGGYVLRAGSSGNDMNAPTAKMPAAANYAPMVEDKEIINAESFSLIQPIAKTAGEDGVRGKRPENNSIGLDREKADQRTDGPFCFEKESFASPEACILSLPGDLYTVQLMGSHERKYLIGISRITNIENESVCFQKKNGSSDWYVLIYNLFSDKSNATASVERLAPDLKAYGPWVRKIADIQREILESGDVRTGRLSASTNSFP